MEASAPRRRWGARGLGRGMRARRRSTPWLVTGALLTALLGAAPVGAAGADPAEPVEPAGPAWVAPPLDVLRSGASGVDLRAAGVLDGAQTPARKSARTRAT